jgi:hypothetical protein
MNYDINIFSKALNETQLMILGDSQCEQLFHALTNLRISGLQLNYTRLFKVTEAELLNMTEVHFMYKGLLSVTSESFHLFNFGATHHVAYNPDYLSFVSNITRSLAKSFALKNSYIMELNHVGAMKRYGITPTRLEKMNQQLKSFAGISGMNFLRSLTEARWEASRDGLHYHGYCRNTTVNECGGVVKAKAFILLNSILLKVLSKKGIDVQEYYSSYLPTVG